MNGKPLTYVAATVGVIGFAVAALPGSAENDTRPLRTAAPHAVHRDGGSAQLPASQYGIPIAYYSVPGNLDTRLTLNNKGPNDMAPVVTLYARDGRRFSSGEIPIAGRTSVDLDLRTFVAAAVDPAEAKTSSYQAGGVRVLPVGNTSLEPVLVARNVGSTQITVRGRLQVTNRDETVTPVDLPSTTIGPMQSVELDGRAAWQQAADISNGTPVGLELEHDGAPGSLVVSAASVSRDGNQVFQVPLTDPETLPSATGGYFWRVEGTRNSVVALKNITDAPQRYNLEIRFSDGVWGQGLRTLQPHESAVIDIGSLQQMQTLDRQGRAIPVTATRGQVHWSIGGGGTARGIVGRIEHVDLARGVSSAYACPQATNDIYVDAWIDPDLQTIAVGGSELYVAWERDEDAWGGGLQSPYEITDILSWQSWNTSVAVIVSVGSDVAEVGGVANGFTGIRATGDSNGWAEYDPGEEDPENHVPIELWADAQVTTAYPTNFRLTSITYFNGSSNSHPLPTIYANYTWDSSTGNRSHLGACEIWEDLDYGTWNSPPFYGQPSDNQLWMADGPDQGFQDIHGTQGPLLMDNGQPVAGSGPLTQRYKFKCTTIQNNALQDITGPDAGPHSVTRETTVNGSNWFFSISKHGNSASCQLRTSSTAGWCQ